MSKIDQSYHQLLNKILNEGYWYDDPNRKDVKRLEIPSYTFRHEFKDGFPAITTKKLNYKNVVTELIWFLRGDTNIKCLIDNDCNIWNKDGYKFYEKCYKKYPLGKSKMSYEEWLNKQKQNYSKHSGDLGKVYGYYWRNFDGIDQIFDLIKCLKEKPLGTEHIVTARYPKDKDNQALPCCHYGFQIVVRPLSLNERRDIWEKLLASTHEILDQHNIPKYGFELHWQQRSVDTFLGLNYNVASYATLALIIEKITGYKALAIQGDLKKVHLYDNSLDAVKEQLSRDINKYNECKLNISISALSAFNDVYEEKEPTSLMISNCFEMVDSNDFELENYESYPHIKCEMLERDE